jgi:hypothetical protein
MQGRIIAMALAVLSGLTVSAGAQELAGSFDQLRVLVAPGQTITVVSADGSSVKGQVLALSPSSLRMAVGGVTRDFAERDVEQVRQRRPDSLANGARNGFFTGVGLGVLGGIVVIASEGGDEWGYLVLGTLTYAALGAGVGVGIDAMIEKERPIFVRRPTARASLQFAPLVGRNRGGMRVAISF